MKLRNTSRAMVAGMAIAAALTMTACSSDDNSAGATSSAAATSAAQTTTAAANANIPPAPTADELNAMLQKGLDPSIPATEKTDMIQGSEADPDLINRVATAVAQNNATVKVTEVQDAHDGTAIAKADVTFNGQTNVNAVQLVFDNGKWKLDKGFACNIVQIAQLQSAACP
ncbi:hypothetical protein [Antrihabitans cavernicola]|uniref:Low molecular weight antigen MTB12-like C-terminal domain-containing protein n=1 Tax=Antrihabitans cavernicola TaxID=2495913 RepID=A0A5A7SET3_9NOCA|nr:hypothetical protein [Spelaeibacter cavernicola]KAA0023153.1 hypothetical protein FOY51_11835 [Spelaeibacter cavernicola]